MTLDFDGRVALITGAGGGLGRQYALELARRGARVVVNDLGGSVDGAGASTDPAQLVVEEITQRGGMAIADTHSVADAEGAEAMVDAALSELGRIDIVVNNAGVIRDEAVHNVSLDAWRTVTDVHLTGTLLVSRAAMVHMRQAGYGRIVNTTSPAGLYGNFGQASYAAAKMGIVGLTRVLAIEGARRGIVANAIAPGAMTRMTEHVMGSMAEVLDLRPELVSPVVAYLAHERCTMSGQVISAAFGRVSQVFIGSTPGYFNRELTAEDVETNLDQITNATGLTFPLGLEAEIAYAQVHYG